MPNALQRACANRWCPETVTPPERYCPECKRAAGADDRERRGSANDRGYSYRWQQTAKAHLRDNPLCVLCLEEEGKVEPAVLVDHIEPHRGDMKKFWNPKNRQSLCETHHNRKTSQEGGFGRT